MNGQAERKAQNGGRRNYESQIEELLSQLSLEEKVGMIHGNGLFRTKAVERLGIPRLVTSDGPMGVRMEFPDDSWIPIGKSDDYVTYNPSNSALAATWNPRLAYESGKVLGEEARGRGKDVILAPGINIKRDPLCGRNFEYMSEDPCLIAALAVPFIKGVQECDVAACIKHFAVNNQETDRLAVDTLVDERTLREIYLPGFQAAVQEGGAYSLMNAYNKFRGVFCSESKELLDDILRGEWKYDGTVISDWGSVHSTKGAAEASLDVEMSVTYNFDEYYLAKPLLEAVRKGEVSEEAVDEKVRNILRMMFRLKMIGPEAADRQKGAYNTVEHQQKTLETARESIVLLKNEAWGDGGRILPLSGDRRKIAVIGHNGEHNHAGGGGSAEIKALYEISPLLGLKKALGGNADIAYAQGYYIPGKKDVNEVNWQEASLERQVMGAEDPDSEEQRLQRQEILENRRKLLEEACALAKEADTVIFVGGLNHDYDTEGRDRTDMKLPYGQDELIEALLEIRPDTVLVIIAGSPVEMPWRDKAKALLWCYYAGMETGDALADILLGKVNPSAKLPETFPAVYEDTATYKNGQFGLEERVVYQEGIFVGYRYYEKQKIKPAFAFGHGLSYTGFAMDHLRVLHNDGEEVVLAVDVANVGSMAGAEVVQCYVTDCACSVERPVKELKAFEKVFLQPGEKKEVRLTLSRSAFSFYDVERKAFVTEPGAFLLHVGNASDHCALLTRIEIR
ncbi:MAG: glycoside hydrolase family 3 C-terminal domain-containing protein [Muribaculum sp.]|nr:glycoside hydrolase family 3 C-terminal domain-containing protein [Muribaculum sp.]